MSQASKNLLFSVVGLAVAGALVAYAYFGVMKPEEQENKAKDVNDRIFSAAAQVEKPVDGGKVDLEFQTLEILAKGQNTKLERKDGKWRVVSPVDAAADRFVVDQITSQLQTAKFKEKLEEKPTAEDLKKYGLDSPRFTASATARFPDGTSKTLKISAGIDNPFDGSVYAQRDSDPAVYTAEGGLRYALEKDTFDLRDKEIFPFDDANLARIEAKGGANYTLERGAKNAWQLKAPIDSVADQQAVTQMIASIRGERAQAFLPDSPERRKDLGLEKPLLDVTVGVQMPTVETVRIRFGSPQADAGAATYALIERQGAATIAEVKSTALTALQKKPDELKDKSVLQFDANAVSKITITPANGAGAPLVVERVKAEDGGRTDQWAVTSAKNAPAKAFKISSLLWNLSNVKATAFGEESPKNWAKYGIGDKSMNIKLEAVDGTTLATLMRGAEVADKPGSIYVRGQKNQVAEVDASRLAELPLTAADLSDTGAADAGVAALR